MVWVTFAKPFNFVPPEDRRCAVRYRAGGRYNVRRVCAQKARAAGALEESDDGSRREAGAGDLSGTGT